MIISKKFVLLVAILGVLLSVAPLHAEESISSANNADQWFLMACGQLFQVTDHSIDRDDHPAKKAWLIQPSPAGSVPPSRWNVLPSSNVQKLEGDYFQLLDNRFSGSVLIAFNLDDGTPCTHVQSLVRCWMNNIDNYRHPYYIYNGYVYPSDIGTYEIAVEHTVHDYLLVNTEITDRSVQLIAQSVPIDLWYKVTVSSQACNDQQESPIVFEKTMKDPWFFMVYLDAIWFFTGSNN